MRLLLTFVASAGDWLLRTGRPAEAVGPLALAHDHPASDHETRARARQLLAAAAERLPPAVYDGAVARSRGADPGGMAARLVPVLTEAPATDSAPPAAAAEGGAAARPPPAAGALAEPLTAPELAGLAVGPPRPTH